MKNPLSFLVQQLLKANKIPVDFEELDFQIQSHPTYPSLHAVTGVLDHFNIENLALDVPNTLETLRQLPDTFLAQVENDSIKQLVVVTRTKNGCKMTISESEKKSLTQSDFLNQFTGILLAVEHENSKSISGEANLKTNIIKGLALTILISLVIVLALSKPSIINLSYLVLSILGTFISLSIFKQEQGESNILGDTFCSKPSEKKNCDVVLSTKAATIYKDLKLSDLSLMYFAGLAFANFLLIISGNTIDFLKLMSFIALPITIYSIYYQSVIIKKWCFLCLSIVAVIWCQSFIAISNFTPVYNIEIALISALSFSFIAVIWLVGSKYFKDNKSLRKIKIDHYKFKRNFELFSTQLNRSKKINTYVKTKNEISFGNKNSNLNITIITNPLCGHCKPVHALVEKILQAYKASTNFAIRFNINPKHPENTAVKIATRLLEIYDIEGFETCLNAMHDIYGENSSDDWFNKWNTCTNPNAYLDTLQLQYDWCLNNSINFTPEILINGQSFPNTYDRKDLFYFIEELVESTETNNPSIPFIKAQNI